MLKEAVHLVDMLSCMREIVRHSDKAEDNTGTLELAQDAINNFIDAIGSIDSGWPIRSNGSRMLITRN